MSKSAHTTAFILGGSADIGKSLVERYAADGGRVVATYLSEAPARDDKPDGVHWIRCDVGNPASVGAAVAEFARLGWRWNLFFSSVGTLEPIGPFFGSDFEAWQASLMTNALGQLRVLHALNPHRGERPAAGFFAGGGTNNPFTNYSAYCVSKILLIKMCELIDDEDPELNAFIVGPGFVDTKIHRQTLEGAERAGSGYDKTLKFLESRETGASYDEIYACINWCIAKGREVMGGRNLSLVHDPWRESGDALARSLEGHPDRFRLRRAKD